MGTFTSPHFCTTPSLLFLALVAARSGHINTSHSSYFFCFADPASLCGLRIVPPSSPTHWYKIDVPSSFVSFLIVRDLAPLVVAPEVPADKDVADLTPREADPTVEKTIDEVAIAPRWPAQELPAAALPLASAAVKALSAHSKTELPPASR
ncbi:hypothetical protein HC256_002723 [Beauveria bassiana]|nr:hypothetical protein HC256_002723 [Beauveria bassiana]